MGMTYAHSFLKSHSTTKDNLTFLLKNEDQKLQLSKNDFNHLFTNPAECISNADAVVLSVKPQDAAALFESIKAYVDAQQLFISIMAGITLETIQNSLGVSKIIRAMPNLPAQIGMGMTVFTSTEAVTRLELVMVQNLLNTNGKTIYVEKESLIDAATAISGSGPAYVFYFMDAMMKAALDMGFNEAEAELLVSQTFAGASDLYNRYDLSCSDWIKKVASKGGTTEAAIRSFEANELYQDIKDGVAAAKERANELGRK